MLRQLILAGFMSISGVSHAMAFESPSNESLREDKLIVKITGVNFQEPTGKWDQGAIEFYAHKVDSKFQFIKCKVPGSPRRYCQWVWDGEEISAKEISHGLRAVSWVGLYDLYGAFPSVFSGSYRQWYNFTPFVRGFAKTQGDSVMRLLKSDNSQPVKQDALGWPEEQLYLLFDVVVSYRNSYRVFN